MSDPRALRTLRQKRLREVGEAGQARLFAAEACISQDGLRGEFAVRYLVGAGITRIAAPLALHAAARSIDAEVQLTESAADADAVAIDAPPFVSDPAARAAFDGALRALRLVRDRLADGAP